MVITSKDGVQAMEFVQERKHQLQGGYECIFVKANGLRVGKNSHACFRVSSHAARRIIIL